MKQRLLVQGNLKVGSAVHHWDLPPIKTCPGRSKTCEKACYATKSRYTFPVVKDRLEWCYQQSLRDDFSELMADNIKQLGVLVLRIHCSGDFYDAAYAEKWLDVMRMCKGVRYYLYSRSWRIPSIADKLEQMAALKSCRVWYSIDKDMERPLVIPVNVRLAYLQVEKEEEPESIDLRFVVRKLKRHAQQVSLPMLCPQQAGNAENCCDCRKCFH